MPEYPRFVLWCWEKSGADPDRDKPDQDIANEMASPLIAQAQRLIEGGRFKTIILWGGNRDEEYDEVQRWP